MPRRAPEQQKTLRLICWNEADATVHAVVLRRAGYQVIADPPETGGGMIRQFRELAPDAVVIDLDRLPSHGRELARGLRASKSTCHLPLLFAGGVAAKVAQVRAAVPDAIYAAWADNLGAAIEAAIAQPPAALTPKVEPPKNSAPDVLARKLDIKKDTHYAIVYPRGETPWLHELLTLPEGTVEQRSVGAETTLALYPLSSRRDLLRAFGDARTSLPQTGSLWIIHPKQTSALTADFNQDDVREIGLAHGFVDYKVCAVDKDWSGLKFARRGATRAKPHVMPRKSR